MNRRSVLIQMALFVVITLGCGYYVTTSVLDAQTFGDPIRVQVRMKEAAGLSAGGRVTYRGTEIGSISDIRIRHDGRGVLLRLSIRQGSEVPADSAVVVTVNSPIGIAHLDLRPRSAGAPYLDDSSVLGPGDVTRPPPLQRVLVDFMRLAESLPTEDLARLTESLSTGLNGLGDELSVLLDNAGTILGMADDQLARLRSIAADTRAFVDNANASGGKIRELARSMRELTSGLREMEPAISELVRSAPEPVRAVTELMASSRSSVSTLLGNLVTTSRIVSVRTPALEQALISLPRTLRELAGIVHGGTANFYLVGTQGPVCYYKTDRRSPTETASRQPRLDWHCPGTSPTAQQRGAVNAPRPNAPAPVREPASQTAQERRTPAELPFDIGSAPPHRVLGPRSWSSILLRGAK